MSGGRFAFYCCVLTVLMAVLIFGFPFILYGLVKASGCQNGTGTCGAVAVVVGTTLRPAAALIYIVAMLWIIGRRCRRTGFSLLWLIPCFLWLVAARGFLIAGMNFWGANFSMGILSISPPVTLLFVFAFVILLAFSRDWFDDGPNGDTRAWNVLQIVTVLSAALAAMLNLDLFFLLAHLVGIPWTGFVGLLTGFPFNALPLSRTSLLAILFIPFVGAILAILLGQRATSSGNYAPPHSPSRQDTPLFGGGGSRRK